MPEKKSPNLSLTKAYEKATGDGPIETTLELTEAEIKRMIRAADKVILDAADTAKKVPGAIVDAAKGIVDAGIDGAKAAGKSWLGAVKSLGSFLTSNGGGVNNVFSTYVPPKPKGDTSPPSMAPFPRPVKPSVPPYVNPDRIATAVPKEEMPKKPLPRKKSPLPTKAEKVNPADNVKPKLPLPKRKIPTVNPDRIDKAKPKNKYSDIDKYL